MDVELEEGSDIGSIEDIELGGESGPDDEDSEAEEEGDDDDEESDEDEKLVAAQPGSGEPLRATFEATLTGDLSHWAEGRGRWLYV